MARQRGFLQSTLAKLLTSEDMMQSNHLHLRKTIKILSRFKQVRGKRIEGTGDAGDKEKVLVPASITSLNQKINKSFLIKYYQWLHYFTIIGRCFGPMWRRAFNLHWQNIQISVFSLSSFLYVFQPSMQLFQMFTGLKHDGVMLAQFYFHGTR